METVLRCDDSHNGGFGLPDEYVAGLNGFLAAQPEVEEAEIDRLYAAEMQRRDATADLMALHDATMERLGNWMNAA